MTTYSALKVLITAHRYTYDDMFAKLDMFFAMTRINMEQYIELTGMLVPDNDELADKLNDIEIEEEMGA